MVTTAIFCCSAVVLNEYRNLASRLGTCRKLCCLLPVEWWRSPLDLSPVKLRTFHSNMKSICGRGKSRRTNNRWPTPFSSMKKIASDRKMQMLRWIFTLLYYAMDH